MQRERLSAWLHDVSRNSRTATAEIQSSGLRNHLLMEREREREMERLRGLSSSGVGLRPRGERERLALRRGGGDLCGFRQEEHVQRR